MAQRFESIDELKNHFGITANEAIELCADVESDVLEQARVVSETIDVDDLPQALEIAEKMCERALGHVESDFEVGDWRFIDADAINDIQQEELSNDLYMLGCFTDWFLANATDIDIEVIQALQEAEAFEALGKLVLPHIAEIQAEYASTDGYGHHFNRYDGEEYEISGVVGTHSNWYAFRTN